MTSKPFDVFLSHNSREKSAVEALSYRLRAEGLNPWLDKEQLIPGATGGRLDLYVVNGADGLGRRLLCQDLRRAATPIGRR